MNVRVIGVEVLVDVEDEVGDASIGVRDLAESVRGTIGDECLSGCPVITREENNLRSGTIERFRRFDRKFNELGLPSLTDSSDGGLNRSGPCNNIWDVVRLVHSNTTRFSVIRSPHVINLHAEDNPVIASVLSSDVAPERSEDIVGRTTLTDNLLHEKESSMFSL